MTPAQREEARHLRREGLTLQAIGERFGVSGEWIRRLTQDVSPARGLDKVFAPGITPIEIEIRWPIKSMLCDRPGCWRKARARVGDGVFCNGHAAAALYRIDPERRRRQRAANRRWRRKNPGKYRSSSRRATRDLCPICGAWKTNIRGHLRGVHPDGDYEALLAEARRPVLEGKP